MRVSNVCSSCFWPSHLFILFYVVEFAVLNLRFLFFTSDLFVSCRLKNHGYRLHSQITTFKSRRNCLFFPLLSKTCCKYASPTLKGLLWLCILTNSNLHRTTLHVQSCELERVLFRAINCRYITAIRCTCNFCIRLCDRTVINCESQLYEQLLARRKTGRNIMWTSINRLTCESPTSDMHDPHAPGTEIDRLTAGLDPENQEDNAIKCRPYCKLDLYKAKKYTNLIIEF